MVGDHIAAWPLAMEGGTCVSPENVKHVYLVILLHH